MTHNYELLTWLYLGFCILIQCFIYKFCYRYLRTTSNRGGFLNKILLMSGLIIAATLIQNLFVLSMNLLLLGLLTSSLIKHEASIPGSIPASRRVTINTVTVGILLLIASMLFYFEANSLLLQKICFISSTSIISYIALTMLIIGLLAFMGLPPFSRWLYCSINSLTPTSAQLHAGLLGLSGIVLIKLAPILELHHEITILLSVYAFTIMLWSSLLIPFQIDYKSKLVNSTIMQFSFMLLQIALGFYASAFLHIILHGFYKAYAFLAMGNQVKEKYHTKIKINFSQSLLQVSVIFFILILFYLLLINLTASAYNMPFVILAFFSCTCHNILLTIRQPGSNFTSMKIMSYITVLIFGYFLILKVLQIILPSQVHTVLNLDIVFATILLFTHSLLLSQKIQQNKFIIMQLTNQVFKNKEPYAV